MIEAELSRSVARWCPGATGVTGAAKLSGGASQETWRFHIAHPDGLIGAILRRSPKGYGAAPTRAAGLAAEAQLMQLAFEAGVPSPRVMHVLNPDEDLGTGFIMQQFERDYRSLNWPKPVFELALRWLRDHDPGPSTEETLVHGDFRNGNLIIGP